VGDVFARWAPYCDWIYEDIVDYEGEVDFLKSAFRRYARGPVGAILDLGCGMGDHASLFAGRGYDVAGVDVSPSMLRIAEGKARLTGRNVEYFVGDMRDFRLGRTVDAVLSLFGSFGYQTRAADVQRALRTAHVHLNPGGLFLFEFWNSTEVIHGHKGRLEGRRAEEVLLRLSESHYQVRSRVLTVEFRFYHFGKGRLVERFLEAHRLRTYGLDEMRSLLRRSGFRVKAFVGLGKPGEPKSPRATPGATSG
jgi:SAM-dependent methyltransferase